MPKHHTAPDGVRQARKERLHKLSFDIDDPWFASNPNRVFRARAASEAELKIIRLMGQLKGYPIVVIAARGETAAGAVQYVGAAPEILDRVADMTDDEIIGGYAPGVRTIAEWALSAEHGCRSERAH